MLVLVVDEPTDVVKFGQQLETKQCSPHSLMMRSHCWSQFLFWVHLQCWKFQKEEPFAAAAAVVLVAAVAVVEATASQGGVFGICLLHHLFL